MFIEMKNRRVRGLTMPIVAVKVLLGSLGLLACSLAQAAPVFYAGEFHIGTPFAKLGIDSRHTRAASFTNTVEAWVPQGAAIHLTPKAEGTVYLTTLRDANMGIAEIRKYAVRSRNAVAGEPLAIETEGLESGTYYLSLIQNGAVVAALRLHLAFTEIPISPDYEVSVVRRGGSESLPSYYSFRRKEYLRYGNAEFKATSLLRDGPIVAHSWAGFSTDDYPITVRLKVRPGAKEISLPLTSAKVLPSSYGIPCRIEKGDTIVFTLSRPEKVIVIPNHEAAWAEFEKRAVGHVPIQNWAVDLRAEMQRESFKAVNPARWLSEGYRNPFVFLGRAAEKGVPEAGAAGTLVVYPGDQPTQAELDRARTVWFKPGPHDFSRLGDWPLFHTKIRSGQTFYLEDGAWLLARIASTSTSDRLRTRLIGRGTLSGSNHFWGDGGFPAGSQIMEVDDIVGINVVERAFFGIEGGRLIDDIAMLASWHGNNDGVDSMDNCTLRNSLLLSHDDNLKLNHNTHAEHIVLMMLGTNAHAIMVKEILTGRVFADSVVKDVDIVGYWKNPLPVDKGWHAVTPGAIASVTGSDLRIQNFTFSDIRIESPFLYRVFSIFNMDTNKAYAADWFWNPTSERIHTRIDGLTFRNITVNSPLIAARSIIGSPYAGSLKGIEFVNLKIGGVAVTEANKQEYFEIDRQHAGEVRFTAEGPGK